MIIRQATKEDSKTLASLIILAMEGIVYELIAERNFEKGIAFLSHFTERQNNQYSYQNCFVAEVNGTVIGVVNAYDGENLDFLRKPVLEYIFKITGRELTVENETEAGEFYIDTIGVYPDFHGQGIGSALIKYLIDNTLSNQNQTLGLLVEVDNPKARKLYLKHGFQFVGFKTLLGKRLEHLQINPED